MDDDMDVDLVMDEEEQGTQAQYADEVERLRIMARM